MRYSVKAGLTLCPHSSKAGTRFERAQLLSRAGAPVVGVQLQIDGQGEVLARGNMVLEGYWEQPEATADAIVDGWFHTGDGGIIDEDNYVSISDRKKDVIISGGENIYPAEIENVINDVEGITGVAVIGVADERWGEVPWAIVTVQDGAFVDTETMLAALDGRLARYKIPKKVIVVDELPRTASGKVRKADLRARFAV